MNLLYISPMIIDFDNLDGVARKLLYQKDAFSYCAGTDKVYLASYFGDGTFGVIGENIDIKIPFKKKSSRQLELMEIYPKLPQICKKLSIKAVYFRIFALSWVSDKLFSDLKKVGIKIAVEIPTYPFWKEKWMDVLDKFKTGKVLTGCKRTLTNIVYFIYAHRLKKYVTTIVTFSDIKKLWGVPVTGIANGYAFKELEEEKSLKTKDEDLHLLMVASVRSNHGADRVIKGLSTYIKTGSKRNVIFHIVGDGDAIPELKELVKNLENVEKQVIFHGFMAGQALEDIYKIGDIGISAIGFHRLGVYYASPLKSKEYFAKGLPVVGTTVEHDVLKSKSSEYYLAFPEDDTDIDIEKVCSFYERLQEHNCTNRQIAESATNDFAWKSIMKPIYEQLK
ncbi:glycosyltransferase [Eisenbergiella porci]|uniref:glycosyltransferase n=1 Tax=Eisenbergiella porci TaxID=2652274 RepID=UPI002A841B0A|nr:glycosyltransferase [Eisenbergiella porci]